MSDKITKQRMYCELVLRMEKLEAKLDKLLTLIESDKVEYKVVINNTSIQDSEQFDESYK